MSRTSTQLPNSYFQFLNPALLSLSFDATQLILTTLNSKILQCVLTLQLSSELYEQVQTQTLFNLNPEIYNVETIASFKPELPIDITISLRPDLLSHLVDHQDDLADYFTQLSSEQTEHPLLSTDSWYVLQVKQQTPTGEIGYRTFWDYVSPSLLFGEDVSSEAIADGLVEFFQDWAESSLPEMTQAALSEVVKDFSQEVEEQLSESDLETLTQDAIATIFGELIEGFDRWTKGETVPPQAQARSLLQIVQDFFQQDGWDFRLFNRENTLRLAFQGKRDRWTCYAQIKEEPQQFVFYSIAPIKIFVEQRGAIAEFITRANYGMIIGNFELDFEDGEVRYKTSIDVTNDQLTSALIKSLVYTNVLTMDQYLPGIRAVLEEGLSAIAAIQQVEAPEVIASEATPVTS